MARLDENSLVISSSVIMAEGGIGFPSVSEGLVNMGIGAPLLEKMRVKHRSLDLPESVTDLTFRQAQVICACEYIIPFNIHKLNSTISFILGHLTFMSWDDGIRLFRSFFNEGFGPICSREFITFNAFPLYLQQAIARRIVDSFLVVRLDDRFYSGWRSRLLKVMNEHV